jgi:hypothetical protein
VADLDDESPGFVIHIPVTATDATSALDLAYRISKVFGTTPQVDVGCIAISCEDDQSRRQQLYCDRLTGPDRRRCGLRSGHLRECVPRAARPDAGSR